MRPTIALSINTTWNIVNFRTGLIKRLQDAGYEVVAIAPADAAVARLRALGVRHVPIAIDNMGSSALRDLVLLKDYWRILHRLKPAAFLGWTVKPNVYGSLAAQMLGIPVINNVSGLGTAFIKRGPLTAIVSSLYRLAFSRSATVFFQNDEDRQLFVRQRLVPAEKAKLLPGSGIDLAAFIPDEAARPVGRPFMFLLVARLLRDKGVGEYAAAAAIVRATCPDVRFALLGFLDVANRTAISREEVEAWTAAGTIDYLGHAEDVRPAMRAADCIVLPSYREGMPRTLLEGAALGKPLIATDVPGCREIARNGVNALTCKVADAQSLAGAMLDMLRMPEEERRRLGRAGRRIAEEEFDEWIVSDRYLTAVSDALRHKPSDRQMPGRR